MKKFLAMLMIAAIRFGIVTSIYALPQAKTQHLKRDSTEQEEGPEG